MDLHIDAVEGAWLVVNVITFGVALLAVADARADKRAIERLDGSALKLMTARGDLRREVLILFVAFCLVVAAVPGIFVDRPIPLSVPIVALYLVALGLLVYSLLGFIDRRALAIATLEIVQVRQRTDNAVLAAAVAENTEITREVGDKADHAYHEANEVNKWRASFTEEAATASAELRDVLDDTHTKVEEVHARVVPPEETT